MATYKNKRNNIKFVFITKNSILPNGSFADDKVLTRSKKQKSERSQHAVYEKGVRCKIIVKQKAKRQRMLVQYT
jgi:hypothetical protein